MLASTFHDPEREVAYVSMLRADIPIVRDLNPPLTTVALPLPQLGKQAMRLTLTDDPQPRRRILRMRGEVVIWASTAKLA